MKKNFFNYLIKTLNGMAYGLFSTLIIGTIIGTIGNYLPEGLIATAVNDLSSILKASTGFGIGIGIAWSLKLDGLKLITCAVSGIIASYMAGTVGLKIGDPLVIYLVVVLTTTLTNLILVKKTPVDIILVPLLSVIIAAAITLLINQPVSYVTTLIGNYVETATTYQPFLMGIVIAVVMGMALTAPISSAAIAIAIGLGGIAGGASVVGCSVQMIGFAVMSRKDNNIGTIISVGIGTSMLQFKNIMKKPIIWLPTIIVSAVLGPIATVVLKLQTTPIGAGMGTSGMVGPIDTINAMGLNAQSLLGIGLLMFVAPIVLVWIIDVLFRKYGLIAKGDLEV